MNKIRFILLIAAFGFFSCEKDNYDSPTAGLAGSFIDAQTKELVEQDIIRGTTIEMIEHGYDNPTPQYLTVKNNGTYENGLLFANTYTVKPVRANFVALAAQDVNIQGQTKLDFEVTPYIRVKDVKIVVSGDKVVATFKLEQNVTNNIKKIGLYAHSDSRVGEPMRLVAVEQNMDTVSNPNQEYTLEMDLTSNSSTLKPGNQYYFRVGSLIDVGEAKLNYAPAVRLSI